MSDEYLLWIDIETFGLDPKDPILEIGLRVTDLELNTVDEISTTVWDKYCNERLFDPLERDDWVLQVHSNNGLFDEARTRGYIHKADIQDVFLMFMTKHFPGDEKPPMCGSSVHADRAWLARGFPKLHDRFHYRNIDISTLKELCKRYNPGVYSKIDQYTTKQERHRVVPDLDDTISEARFYLDNFLLY
jgi:oligoribonuclease